MKKRVIIILFVLTFIIEITICSVLFTKIDSVKQDTIKINECVKSVEENYYDSSKYYKKLDYTIIDNNGNLVYKTNKSKTKSLNDAIKNNDIILDVKVNNLVVGKILISNNTGELIDKYREYLRFSIIIMSLVQILLIILYLIYLDRNIIRPFKKLNSFAERVASGNLDLPLYMDKHHAFGEFSEAFDLMRSELKKARISEKKAIEEKKEIIAKLSHDIKTPVASIKSTSEVGYEKTKEESSKKYFNLINTKTDQIKLLV
ncbi:MAG: sensor histidine kinase, partial [Bacilli bacterium]|nr:sensor histidine kinase [Bacilli bacterium]